MFLLNRGRATTDRLAEELEVSAHTILRDLYALRVAGFSVYTERGSHGGCYLHEEYRNTLTQLTADEIAALFLSTIQEPLKDLGLSERFGQLLQKMSHLTEELQPQASCRENQLGAWGGGNVTYQMKLFTRYRLPLESHLPYATIVDPDIDWEASLRAAGRMSKDKT